MSSRQMIVFFFSVCPSHRSSLHLSRIRRRQQPLNATPSFSSAMPFRWSLVANPNFLPHRVSWARVSQLQSLAVMFPSLLHAIDRVPLCLVQVRVSPPSALVSPPFELVRSDMLYEELIAYRQCNKKPTTRILREEILGRIMYYAKGVCMRPWPNKDIPWRNM